MITYSITFLSLQCRRIGFHCSVYLQRFIMKKIQTSVGDEPGTDGPLRGEGGETLIWAVSKSVKCVVTHFKPKSSQETNSLGGPWTPRLHWKCLLTPVRRSVDFKSSRRHICAPTERQMSLNHHYLDEWKLHLRSKCKAWAGINSVLAFCAVHSLTMRLWDMYPYTGVSLHVWLHVFGRYLTTHLSGNLRCWYSCYPSLPLLPHARRFLGKGSVFEAGRRGCLMWEGEHGF